MYISGTLVQDWLPERKERKIGHMTSFRKPIQAVWFLSVVKVVKMVDYEISLCVLCNIVFVHCALLVLSRLIP